MTAPKSPDASPETSKHLADQQGFIYDEPSGSDPQAEYEYDPNYVPEREFVLMPLFRRIGEMLGLRRPGEEQEYTFTPASVASQEYSSPAAEPEQLSASPVEGLNEQQVAPELAPAQLQHEQNEEEDVLGMEPEIAPQPMLEHEVEPEPVFAHNASASEPAFTETEPEPFVAVHETEMDPEPMRLEQPVELVAEPVAQAHTIEEPVSVVPVARVQPEVYPIAARAEVAPAAPSQPILTQEDIKQLIVPIGEAARDAAAKISLAVSQAAEWIQTKEEEIFRRAQENRPDRSQWEPAELPAVQREGAQDEHPAPLQRESAVHAVAAAPPRPQLVSKPATVPFWKRIDWSREFTPRRVAVLGAVAMAMLMVVGVSLARRPASSVLPQQQQTRALQPGGVTLTTHPPIRNAVPARPSSGRVESPGTSRQAAATAPKHAHRRANADDGPDVVTHYYGDKAKPSPVHQSSVAGVRHYSDMQ